MAYMRQQKKKRSIGKNSKQKAKATQNNQEKSVSTPSVTGSWSLFSTAPTSKNPTPSQKDQEKQINPLSDQEKKERIWFRQDITQSFISTIVILACIAIAWWYLR